MLLRSKAKMPSIKTVVLSYLIPLQLDSLQHRGQCESIRTQLVYPWIAVTSDELLYKYIQKLFIFDNLTLINIKKLSHPSIFWFQIQKQ